MMVLLMMIAVSAMCAEQKIWLNIAGKGKTQVSVDGKSLSFNEENMATVTDAGGLKVVVSLKPDDGYSVTSVKAQMTTDAGSAETRSYDDASFIDVKHDSGNDYTFIMPKDLNVKIDIVFTYTRKGTTIITSLSQIESDGNFVINSNIDASGFTGIASFNGTLTANINPTTKMPYRIRNLSVPLFTTLTGTVHNLVLEDVSISGHQGNTGAIACTANKAARIYNVGILSGSVGGTGNTGGIVGLLEGTARVINCYSFATITGGSNVGGIVGNNNATTTAKSIQTMVMNCMFYGDITDGSTVSPVFGGTNIANLQGGLNTFNYYAYDELNTKAISEYNSALAVEEKYLNRFEFYRLLLNSNKKLAAFYATGDVANGSQMLKWVLETADRTIDAPKPYPILKAQGYYPSIINPDAANAPDSTTVGRNHGGKLPSPRNTLTVTISSAQTTGGQTKPDGASITTSSLTLVRTDKDFDRFNYNYDKVQLPYYNDVGTGNYTGNRVVTGWKITAITAVTGDPYTSANYPTTGIKDFPDHNYADRKSSNKDLYSVSKRVFSQGAYFDVPYGVTSITIEPYWGKACYIADENYDVVYKNDYSGKQFVTQTGTQVTVGTTTFNGQNVQKSIEPSLTYIANSLGGLGPTVYDNALVLVGNLHLDAVPLNGDRPFTMMSVDADNDHEPDYSLIYHHKNRTNITPIRFDFLNIPGTAQAQKPNGASLICNFTIVKTRGWFEITNTALVHSDQLEYENADLGGPTKIDSPLILLGGIFDQFVSTQSKAVSGKTIYIHVGGNVWIKEFGMGTHSDGNESTPHVPVSVTGGEFPGFYLTGTYKADAKVRTDNAECYISGGYFHEAAGAALEQINGNVRWQIYNADIDNFFGGGINDAKPITGDITTEIYNSHVTLFCGGPKFGNMQTGKTVTTNAEGCTFGKYFGAGYGGTSIAKKKYFDNTSPNWGTLQGYYYKADGGDRGKYFDGSTTQSSQTSGKDYGKKGPGVATDFDYEFFVWTSGATGARLYVKFAAFSLAQCNDVSSTLKNCTVETNFYGGGNLGKVVGTATSVLEDCTVKGSVYGAGYSASLPTVEVRDAGFTTNPNYNSQSGMFEPGVFSGTTPFTWQNATAAGVTLNNNSSGSDLVNHILYTDIALTGLGEVANTNLTIKGSTTVAESVFGGGEESNVSGNTNVYICAEQNGNDLSFVEGNAIITGNVFGGGKGKDDNFRCDKAMVGVNDAGACENPASETNKNNGTRVIIGDGTVNGNVYGGGEVGRVEWNTQVTIGVGDGTPEIMGSVFGAGAGKETHGYSALVRGNSSVTVQGKAMVKQNVYGGGEKATVGRYWVKGIPADPCPGEEKPEEPDVPNEMPYQTRSGGKCTVTIQGEAQIGAYEAADKYKGHVFGAGKGVEPNYVYGTDNKAGWSRRMVDYNPAKHTGDPGTTWDYYPDNHNYVWEYFDTEAKYLVFLQSLALVTSADVTINGSTSVTSVKGNVYGGSESGFVQDDTKVEIKAGIIGAEGTTNYGNVFGGGRGLSAFAEAGKVKGNTNVTISGGTTNGSVYGGGELGDVGTINKANINSYRWTDLTVEPYTYNNTGVCTVSITGASAEIKGHVFGAGRGEAETFECEKAMAYGTNINISKGTVNGNVYGGGQIGRVENNAVVTIGVENETKSDTSAPLIKGSVFGAGAGVETHGYAALMRGNSAVTIQGNAKVNQSIYGGGEIASVGRYWVKTLPKLDDAPEPPEGLPLGMPYETRSGGDCTVIVRDNAIIGSDGTDDAGNVFGAGKGVDPHFDPGNSKRMFKDSEGNNVWDTFASEAQYLSFLETMALATKPDVTIAENAIVKGSVFGGGQIGITKGSVKVNITGGTVSKDVYGGGALANTNADNWNSYQNTWTTSKYNQETHATSYTTEVALTGGTVNGNVYGGGLGRKAVEGKAAIGEAGLDGYVPAVEAVKGIEAKVYGDVLVELNKNNGLNGTENTDNCIVKGDIFGCNNLNGSPQNAVTVHVYKTVEYDDAHTKSANRNGTTFDLNAVYGGGNQAAFEPYSSRKNATDEEKALSYAKVIIDGCDLTSIKQVYGGGNAAATPGTNVIVNSAYEIDEVFGGGNGLDDVLENGKYYKNPGANVGYGNYSELDGTGAGTQASPYNCVDKENALTKELRRANYMYGSGAASVNIYGGRIHRVFGGSNTKGNVCETAVTILDNEDPCSLNIDEAYGGGKSAPMDAEAKLLMACLPGLNEAYGGAQDADVMGDVILNITNGTFDRVFGGNNISGTIHGKITVNIEETGCQPLIIGELYGGGNKAPYSVYGYSDDRTPKTSGDKVYTDPVVNVKSFTSIGNIYGGGYGETAVMYGDPTVNVNVVEGKWKDKVANEEDDDYNTPGYMYDATGYKGTTKEIGGENVAILPHGKGKIGVINNVFGGGNAAPVVGNTHVNIGTTNSETYVTGDNASHEVKGVDIRGNVYGGGNKAEVTGNTNVVVGKSSE